MDSKKNSQQANHVPMFGRDEMNLVEFPFGPVTAANQKTFEVHHPVFDKQLKKEVVRSLLITGSDAFGLPKPIDDQVLVGMKALTYENGFRSRKVSFSRYQLCRIIGWSTDGRAYKRLEESFDRIAGVMMKFKDSWWDKSEKEWKSKTFHLVEEVELCSKDRFAARRLFGQSSQSKLCSFVWNETIWKSFADGNIKKLDMELFRRIRSGRRKEIAVRLFRVLDKRFYNSPVARFDLEKLCKGILGLDQKYCQSEMVRILNRSADWLVECEFMSSYSVRPKRNNGKLEAVFYKRGSRRQESLATDKKPSPVLDAFENMPIVEKENLEREAIRHCQLVCPHIAEGYIRNKSKGTDSARSYLEMVLTEYFSSKISLA